MESCEEAELLVDVSDTLICMLVHYRSLWLCNGR
jgi:hypothetical protein